MIIPQELQHVLVSTPDTMSGAVRFRGTRVSVQALFDTMRGNRSIDFFLEGYPGVTLTQVEAVLKYDQSKLLEAETR